MRWGGEPGKPFLPEPAGEGSALPPPSIHAKNTAKDSSERASALTHSPTSLRLLLSASSPCSGGLVATRSPLPSPHSRWWGPPAARRREFPLSRPLPPPLPPSSSSLPRCRLGARLGLPLPPPAPAGPRRGGPMAYSQGGGKKKVCYYYDGERGGLRGGSGAAPLAAVKPSPTAAPGAVPRHDGRPLPRVALRGSRVPSTCSRRSPGDR